MSHLNLKERTTYIHNTFMIAEEKIMYPVLTIHFEERNQGTIWQQRSTLLAK